MGVFFFPNKPTPPMAAVGQKRKGSDDDGRLSKKPRGGKSSSPKSRPNHPRSATNKMWKWLELHWDDPKPTREEKKELADQTGLTVKQITSWFSNARCRYWQAGIPFPTAVKTPTEEPRTNDTVHVPAFRPVPLSCDPPVNFIW